MNTPTHAIIADSRATFVMKKGDTFIASKSSFSFEPTEPTEPVMFFDSDVVCDVISHSTGIYLPISVISLLINDVKDDLTLSELAGMEGAVVYFPDCDQTCKASDIEFDTEDKILGFASANETNINFLIKGSESEVCVMTVRASQIKR